MDGTNTHGAGAGTQPGSDLPGSDVGLVVGQSIVGRYEVRRILGRGAMGEVLEVRDRQSGINYALKRVLPELVRDPSQMEAIRLNFSLVSQLTHPHIATTRHLEIDPNSGHALVIMDLVRGKDLAHWISEKRQELGHSRAPMSMEIAVGVAEQIASALDYAHDLPISSGPDGQHRQHGILHRDLKPANVMVESGREYRPGVPFVKLVDFGLAAEIQASLQSLSVVKADDKIGGTPAYMAPEQWEGRTLTSGVDQWALAVIVYEMLAGRRPFEAPVITVLMNQIREANPEPIGTISDAHWSVMKRTFQPDRRKRHPSCSAFIHALTNAASGPSPIASGVDTALGSGIPNAVAGISSQQPPPSEPIRPISVPAFPPSIPQPSSGVPVGVVVAILAMLGIGLVLAVGVGAWMLFKKEEPKVVKSEPSSSSKTTSSTNEPDAKAEIKEAIREKRGLKEDKKDELAGNMRRWAEKKREEDRKKQEEAEAARAREVGRSFYPASNFSIEFPKGWEVGPGAGNLVAMAKSPAGLDDNFQENIIVETLNTGLTLDQYFDATRKSYANLFNTYEENDTSTIRIDGREAKYFIFSYNYGQVRLKAQVFVIERNGKAFGISCTALYETFYQFQDKFTGTAKSFRHEQ